MKKILFSLFILTSYFGFSQLTMAKLDGTPINNNDIFTYNSLVGAGSYMGLKMFNTSDSNIKVKGKIVSMTNATGGNLQFCIGPVCVNNITVGNSYPNSGFTIEANGENGNFDHFDNHYAGDGVNPVEYTLKFYMINASNVEVGNSITFTYRYNPTLSTSDFESLANTGVVLQSNLLQDQMHLVVSKNIQMDLFDLNGRIVVAKKLNTGEHHLFVSDLPTGIYIANFTNEEGKKATAKLIKK